MVKFTTARGASVVLTNNKGTIAATINGSMDLHSVELIDDSQHGLSVFSRWGRQVTIPVPAEAQAEVSKLFADNAAAVKASLDADIAYDAHAERVRRAMEG